MPARRARSVVVVAAAALTVAGCNDDGRTLAPTSATMPPPTTATTAAVRDALGLRVTSPDVFDGGALDARFTCDGAGVAPTFTVSGAPGAAAELALAVVDLDAAERVHLVVSGLPSTTAQLDVASPPDGAVVGRSDGGVVGWDPPCPGADDLSHRYEVRLYAAAEPIGLAVGLAGSEAVAVIEAAALDVARLGFTYGSAVG